MRSISLFVTLGCVAVAVSNVEARTVNVNCNRGRTISGALARLDRQGPNTVNVRGTCVEEVMIGDFEQLTLQGRGNAVIAAPGEALSDLHIYNSRSVVIQDFTIGSTAASRGWAVLTIGNCFGCQVLGSTMEGLTGLWGQGQVSFLNSTFHANGQYAALASHDSPSIQMTDCTVEPGTGWGWAGIVVETRLDISRTNIRGFGIGIVVNRGNLKLGPAPLASSDTDQIVVEDNLWSGIEVSSGGAVSLAPSAGSSVLVRNNGSGVVARSNSIVEVNAPNAKVEISDNANVGIMVTDGSHAELKAGTRILGTAGNGLVVVNNSTVTAAHSFEEPPHVEISGSTSQDIFCDTTSIISNAAQITATKVMCPNMNAGPHVALP